MSVTQSRVIFAIAATALVLQTRLFIPWLSDATGIETIVSWFLCAGLGVFLPLIIAGWLLLEKEGDIGPGSWRELLRFSLLFGSHVAHDERHMPFTGKLYPYRICQQIFQRDNH